jgi:hypothetical protein
MIRAACLLSIIVFSLLSAACHKKRVPPFSSNLKMSDPSSARQLIAGFYSLEQGKWRWAAGHFAVVLKPPPGSERTGATLQLKFFIPDTQIDQLGPMTLSADVGDVSLASETFAEGGILCYRRDIPPALIGPNLLPVVFRFNKVLAPFQTDGRELAAVVTEVSLELRKQTSGAADALTAGDDTK